MHLLSKIILLSLLLHSNSQPIVLLHGLESNSNNLLELKSWLEITFNKTVFNIELGNGNKYSINTPIDVQIEELKKTIKNITELSNGFDFIGLSQGGLIGRGLVQKYNIELKINNLITIASPHGGIYMKNIKFINFYTKNIQQTLSISNYWRDPTKLSKYYEYSKFLTDANCEIQINENYKKNMILLNNFIMIYTPNDTIIIPPTSAIFSIFDKNLNIIPLESTKLYIDDLIGLKYLKLNNKLYFFSTNCTHVDHREPVCFPQLYNILKSFL